MNQQYVDTVRLLLAVAPAVFRSPRFALKGGDLPGNAGHAWTGDEDARLAEAFKTGDSPKTLAAKHGRPLRAIEARLQRMGLLAPEDRETTGGFGSER